MEFSSSLQFNTNILPSNNINPAPLTQSLMNQEEISENDNYAFAATLFWATISANLDEQTSAIIHEAFISGDLNGFHLLAQRALTEHVPVVQEEQPAPQNIPTPAPTPPLSVPSSLGNENSQRYAELIRSLNSQKGSSLSKKAGKHYEESLREQIRNSFGPSLDKKTQEKCLHSFAEEALRKLAPHVMDDKFKASITQHLTERLTNFLPDENLTVFIDQLTQAIPWPEAFPTHSTSITAHGMKITLELDANDQKYTASIETEGLKSPISIEAKSEVELYTLVAQERSIILLYQHLPQGELKRNLLNLLRLVPTITGPIGESYATAMMSSGLAAETVAKVMDVSGATIGIIAGGLKLREAKRQLDEGKGKLKVAASLREEASRLKESLKLESSETKKRELENSVKLLNEQAEHLEKAAKKLRRQALGIGLSASNTVVTSASILTGSAANAAAVSAKVASKILSTTVAATGIAAGGLIALEGARCTFTEGRNIYKKMDRLADLKKIKEEADEACKNGLLTETESKLVEEFVAYQQKLINSKLVGHSFGLTSGLLTSGAGIAFLVAASAILAGGALAAAGPVGGGLAGAAAIAFIAKLAVDKITEHLYISDQHRLIEEDFIKSHLGILARMREQVSSESADTGYFSKLVADYFGLDRDHFLALTEPFHRIYISHPQTTASQ